MNILDFNVLDCDWFLNRYHYMNTIDDLINEEGETAVSKVKLVRIDIKKKSELIIIGSVVAYILAIFLFLILPFAELTNLFIFGVILAVATGFVICGGFLSERFRMLNNIDKNEKVDKDNKNLPISYKARKDAMSSLVSISATVIFLYLGFFKGLWHPGWIIYLTIPISVSLFDVIFGGKIDNEEDID